MRTAHPAAEFIVAMFGPHKNGRVCITSLPNIADGKPDGAPIYTRSSKQLIDFIAKHDRPGFGCFVCVNPIKDKATRRAVAPLCAEYGKHMREHPDELPVIKLDQDSYMHPDRSIGRVKFPLFPVKKWLKAAPYLAAVATLTGKTMKLPPAQAA